MLIHLKSLSRKKSTGITCNRRITRNVIPKSYGIEAHKKDFKVMRHCSSAKKKQMALIDSRINDEIKVESYCHTRSNAHRQYNQLKNKVKLGTVIKQKILQ